MAYLLIVDDDEDFANATAMALRRAGHEVEMTPDLRAAEKRMNERRPDLVVLDVMFPEDSSAGFTFAREIRDNRRLKDVPILMLTAVNQRFPLGFSDKDKGGWMPVDAFVEKPVDFDVLSRRVAAMLQGR
jgi:DNA-binding response OmpR family regulator